MKHLKFLISALIIVTSISACKKEDSDPQIFVEYNWTAGLQYYHDDVAGDIYLDSDRSISYGPVKSGSHSYTYKLVHENTERKGTFVVGAPLKGKRTYSIGIYNYSFEVNYFDEK